MLNDAFKQAIEEIKLRAPIEEVVRERVSGLRRSGSLFTACCPFHEEKTPSFKVDPRRGTWHCFGSCASGGDQISFLQRSDGLSFLEAVEILAARTGVELPRRAGQRAEDARQAALFEVLEQAGAFYRRALASPEGARARAYLARRGLGTASIEAFGLGYAPAEGTALLSHARRSGLEAEKLELVGLARRNDRGRAYDFFRGRLMIPIRDLKARTIGFGARLIEADERGPKYINSPESPIFHKGRSVYGIDRAAASVRKGGHLVLVEGYTDVIAAHQVGLSNVVAVLGTATTEAHAGLLRRTGARRISLVFDGDAAGREASLRALSGLLGMHVSLDVACLAGGVDPADLVLSEGGGAQALESTLEGAREWFDFVTEGLAKLRGRELSDAVDRVLELITRLPKPVERESCLAELAARLEMPTASLRGQYEELPERRRARRREQEGLPGRQRESRPGRARGRSGQNPAAQAESGALHATNRGSSHAGAGAARQGAQPVRPDPRQRRAFAGVIGAVLLDNSLLPLVEPYAVRCTDPSLKAILEAVLTLDRAEREVIDASAVMAALGDDPARDKVVPVLEYAARAETPQVLLEGELRYLQGLALEQELSRLQDRIAELESAELESAAAAGEEASVVVGSAPETAPELSELYASMARLLRLKDDPSRYLPENLPENLPESLPEELGPEQSLPEPSAPEQPTAEQYTSDESSTELSHRVLSSGEHSTRQTTREQSTPEPAPGPTPEQSKQSTPEPLPSGTASQAAEAN